MLSIAFLRPRTSDSAQAIAFLFDGMDISRNLNDSVIIRFSSSIFEREGIMHNLQLSGWRAKWAM